MTFLLNTCNDFASRMIFKDLRKTGLKSREDFIGELQIEYFFKSIIIDVENLHPNVKMAD